MQRDVHAMLAFVNGRVRDRHAWGRRANDCVSFIDGAVKAQTGKSYLGQLAWSSRSGALRLLAREGGMEAALDRRFKRIAPAHAHRGDIAGVPASLLGLPEDEAGLIAIHPFLVEGDTLCAPGPRGLKRVPRSAMTVAWSVTQAPEAAARRKRKPK